MEVWSESLGGWQPATVEYRDGDEIEVSYGEDVDPRWRMVDLSDSEQVPPPGNMH